MLGEHHGLAQEFPEYKDKIHELKTSDPEFAKLFSKYEEIDKEIEEEKKKLSPVLEMNKRGLPKIAQRHNPPGQRKRFLLFFKGSRVHSVESFKGL